MNTNAGLWGYSIGDTVKFVSLDPYRIVVSGRIKHFISAFGEHVIGEEVEKAMQYAMQKHPEVELVEFTVAPQVTPPEGGLPYHEWFIEFDSEPEDLEGFAQKIDTEMRQQNGYYDDLIKGNLIEPLSIRAPSLNNYYMVSPKGAVETKKTQVFKAWLKESVGLGTTSSTGVNATSF
jgi:acyl-CoA synthetase (AMP-forming)/AMP-acid ligase II